MLDLNCDGGMHRFYDNRIKVGGYFFCLQIAGMFIVAIICYKYNTIKLYTTNIICYIL